MSAPITISVDNAQMIVEGTSVRYVVTASVVGMQGPAGGGAGGASAWGDITGTLSAQGDLQAALDAKQAAGSYATAAQGALADSAVQPADLAPYAPLASPTLTGTPSAPTATPGDDTAQIAATAFVTAAVAALINAAPGALDTLDELAAALGDDANFAATITAALALKAPLASPALTGTPTVPTASPGANTTQAASTAYVVAALAALLATSNTFTKAQGAQVVTLTDGATISLDASLSNAFKVTLGGNRTMAAPTGLVEGRVYTLIVKQDGTGSRTMTWNAVFKWMSGSAPTLKTAAGSTDLITFYHDGANLCAVHAGGY